MTTVCVVGSLIVWNEGTERTCGGVDGCGGGGLWFASRNFLQVSLTLFLRTILDDRFTTGSLESSDGVVIYLLAVLLYARCVIKAASVTMAFVLLVTRCLHVKLKLPSLLAASFVMADIW